VSKDKIEVGSVIRMWHAMSKRYRVWRVVAQRLGGTAQESTYELVPLDVIPGDGPEGLPLPSMHVPTILLDNNTLIEVA
jgi:hypothetical protein